MRESAKNAKCEMRKCEMRNAKMRNAKMRKWENEKIYPTIKLFNHLAFDFASLQCISSRNQL
eukprot:Pgem_evm1s8629